MRILVSSDWHLDYWSEEPRVLGIVPHLDGLDALILAGDLADNPLQSWPLYLGWLGRHIDPAKVCILPGNHDYYCHHLTGDDELKGVVEAAGMTFAQKRAPEFGNTRFLCCTLWTDFALFGTPERSMAEARWMEDFELIQRDAHGELITLDDIRAQHRDHLSGLTRAIAEPHPGRTVIVTHHQPSPAIGSRPTSVSPFFISNLDNWVLALRPRAPPSASPRRVDRDPRHRLRLPPRGPAPPRGKPVAERADRHRPPRSSGPLNRSTAMSKMFDDTHYDVFMRWALEPPPVGCPAIETSDARISPPGKPPEILVNGKLHPVIGVTPSGWLSTVGFGWCRFTGTHDALSSIACACSPIQRRLLTDRAAFDAALQRHMARSDESRIGGLPVIPLAGGQRAVRLADIAVPAVRTAIQTMVDRVGPAPRIGPDDEPRPNEMPPGLIDAERWWWFCRNWSG